MASGFISFYNLIIRVVLHCPLGYSSLPSPQYRQCLPRGLGHEKYEVKLPFCQRCARVEAGCSPATRIYSASGAHPLPLPRRTSFFSSCQGSRRGSVEASRIWGPSSFCRCVGLLVFFMLVSFMLQKPSASARSWSSTTPGSGPFI